MKTVTIRMKSDDVAEVLLYDQIGEDFFFGDGISAKTFRKQLKDIKAGTINLRVNSPGGSVTEAAAMLAALDEHPARIEVDVDGLAASAASVVMMAGDIIRVASNGLVMIHNPIAGVRGGAEEMRRVAELLDKMKDQILDAYERKSSAGRDQLAAWMAAETWFTGKEAVEAGLADEASSPVSMAAFSDKLKLAAKWGALRAPTVQEELDLMGEQMRAETERRKAIAARL